MIMVRTKNTIRSVFLLKYTFPDLCIKYFIGFLLMCTDYILAWIEEEAP